MNDFTKKELKLIHDGLSYAAGASIETGGMIRDILYPMAYKIQSMINNYCEHETDAGGCSGEMIYKCKKCGLSYKA